ncbi:hypothetical protein BGZ65_012372, partial [Modicella reniformis]
LNHPRNMLQLQQHLQQQQQLEQQQQQQQHQQQQQTEAVDRGRSDVTEVGYYKKRSRSVPLPFSQQQEDDLPRAAELSKKNQNGTPADEDGDQDMETDDAHPTTRMTIAADQLSHHRHQC